MFKNGNNHRVRSILLTTIVVLLATLAWSACGQSGQTEPSAPEAISAPVASPERVTASDLFRAERQEARDRALINSDVNRLTASDLFRADHQESCERRLIQGDGRLTGSTLMRVAHQDAYEQALAWDMQDVAAHELKLAQAFDIISICSG